jgi:hypothetical protein
MLPRAFIASSYFMLLSSDPFAFVAGLVEASKNNLLCVQRRKAKTLQLSAFEDIQSDFINHGLAPLGL